MRTSTALAGIAAAVLADAISHVCNAATCSELLLVADSRPDDHLHRHALPASTLTASYGADGCQSR